MANKCLTERQKQFCEFYLNSHNATDAARKAGYTDKNAGGMGFALLRNPKIQEHLHSLTESVHTNNIMTLQQLQEFWTNVVNDLKNPMKDRLRASELLGKSMAAFIQRVDIQDYKITVVEPEQEEPSQAE